MSPWPGGVRRRLRGRQESNVIGVVVVSHGPLAEGLKAAAEMIIGPQPMLRTVGMSPAGSLDDLRREIDSALQEVGGADMSIVLVDVMGGSPGNASAYVAMRGTPVVCGANLPIMLEVLMAREDTTPRDLADRAVLAGRNSILDLGQQLSAGLAAQGR